MTWRIVPSLNQAVEDPFGKTSTDLIRRST
jgi:hypothetical protein